MRLGVSTSFAHTSPLDWINKHKKLSLKSIVFPLSCEASQEKIKSYADLAKENDITIAEVGIWRNTLAADKKERAAMMDYAISSLIMADSIGAACCVNVAGTPHGPRWDGGYRKNFDDDTRKEIIKMIRTIIDEANPKNTKFTIESMPWMVPTSPDDYVRLLNEVERDAFGVHLDLINMVTSIERYFFLDEFMEECFDKLGTKLLSCHLKDVALLPDYTFMLKECAPGEGNLNIPGFIKCVDAINPDMPVIIEHLNTDSEYERAVRYVQKFIS